MAFKAIIKVGGKGGMAACACIYKHFDLEVAKHGRRRKKYVG